MISGMKEAKGRPDGCPKCPKPKMPGEDRAVSAGRYAVAPLQTVLPRKAKLPSGLSRIPGSAVSRGRARLWLRKIAGVPGGGPVGPPFSVQFKDFSR